MRRRSNSAIMASFIALRVSGRYRVRVTMLSRLWYNTGLSAMLALLVPVGLLCMQNGQQQLLQSAAYRGRINVLLHGMCQGPARDPQTHRWNTQAEGEVGIRARCTEQRRPQTQVVTNVADPTA